MKVASKSTFISFAGFVAFSALKLAESQLTTYAPPPSPTSPKPTEQNTPKPNLYFSPSPPPLSPPPTVAPTYTTYTSPPTPYPTKRPSPLPTATPTLKPTKYPTLPPTKPPTKAPTPPPTKASTQSPTKKRTLSPTKPPTKAPTSPPTKPPSLPPTIPPTAGPTSSPSKIPTLLPTGAPSSGPTASPTTAPTLSPSNAPTALPTPSPTQTPSSPPTTFPTPSPTPAPTQQPTPPYVPAPTTCPSTCITMTRNSMEGALTLSPGASIFGGFNLKINGNHPAVTISLVSGFMTYFATCGTQQGAKVTFQVPIPAQSYRIPASNPDNFPTNNEASPLTFQTGSFTVPNSCNGQKLSFAAGASFSGCFTSDKPNIQIQLQFHYHPNDYSGASWSQTQGLIIGNACAVMPNAPAPTRSPSKSPLPPIATSPPTSIPTCPPPTKVPTLSPMTPPTIYVAPPSVSPTSGIHSCPSTCITMNRNSMEGALTLSPGASIYGGFNFKMSGSHPDTTITLVEGYMTYFATCGSQHGAEATFQAPFPSVSYMVPANSGNNVPINNEASPLTFQTGSFTVPNSCGDQKLSFAAGASFTGCFISDQPNVKFQLQFHYHPNDYTGASWSQTQGLIISNACV